MKYIIQISYHLYYEIIIAIRIYIQCLKCPYLLHIAAKIKNIFKALRHRIISFQYRIKALLVKTASSQYNSNSTRYQNDILQYRSNTIKYSNRLLLYRIETFQVGAKRSDIAAKHYYIERKWYDTIIIQFYVVMTAYYISRKHKYFQISQ